MRRDATIERTCFKPYMQKGSRVLISTVSRSGIGGISSESKTIDEGHTAICLFPFWFPNHGAKMPRTAFTIGPAGSALVWTRSTSSE